MGGFSLVFKHGFWEREFGIWGHPENNGIGTDMGTGLYGHELMHFFFIALAYRVKA